MKLSTRVLTITIIISSCVDETIKGACMCSFAINDFACLVSIVLVTTNIGSLGNNLMKFGLKSPRYSNIIFSVGQFANVRNGMLNVWDIDQTY